MTGNDGRKKILLVDDNEMQLTFSKMQLSEEYDVTTAMSGREALACLFRGLVPDVIVLDILMPDMSGWETFGRLKAISLLHAVPIVFLSSLNEEDEIKRAYEMGAVDYITKPYDAKDFQERIKKVLEKDKAAAPSL